MTGERQAAAELADGHDHPIGDRTAMRTFIQPSAALLALLALAAAPAAAQTAAPATPGAADGQEVQDSGVGETDTSAWVGKPVVTAAGEAVGTLSQVQAATGNTDGGTLVIAREGGGEVKAPLQGASFDGQAVTVASTMEALDGAATASTN
jgi:hypothetical protein